MTARELEMIRNARSDEELAEAVMEAYAACECPVCGEELGGADDDAMADVLRAVREVRP